VLVSGVQLIESYEAMKLVFSEFYDQPIEKDVENYYDPLPDEAFVDTPNPWEMAVKLEAKVAMLMSNNAELKRALRGMLNHPNIKTMSDGGWAPWYQYARRALRGET